MSKRSDKPLVTLPGPSCEVEGKPGVPERRADIRYHFTAAAEIFDILSQTRINGRTSDIGPSGCYIDTLSPFAAGSLVRLCLEHEVQEFQAIATVAYANAPMGMGLAFSDIEPESQAVLKTWLAKLSGGHPPEAGVMTGPEGGVLAAAANVRHVMKELITLMVRKKIISENEGAGLMRQMFR
jgi:hypothetical protein